MGEATWLASYPKSGNTWTRAFLIALTGDRCEVNINGLGKISIASSAAPFEFAAGIRVSDLTEDEIERLRPEVHRFLVEMADGHCFFKAHDAYIFTDEGVPLFPTSVTRGAVYLLRNPLDVAVSWANHGNIPLREAVAQLNSVN
ncbi:MAG: sulfotransferase domain-containing protein, partial [Desulfobacterales bacterium]|nr:sulfotransferase domain-containing protein [Desulfobacterales bacterium]